MAGAKHRVSSKQRLDLIKAALYQFDNLQSVDVSDYAAFLSSVRAAVDGSLVPKSLENVGDPDNDPPF